MGTKNNPGPYDCYAKAASDEPIFTLRAKDPIAPYLVRIWALTRQGAFIEAVALLTEASKDKNVRDREFMPSANQNKLVEAFECASSMVRWYNTPHPQASKDKP